MPLPSQYFRVHTAQQQGTLAADAVAALNAMRDLLAQTIGAWPIVSVTIANGQIAPWTGTGETITAGTLLRVDTEGGAATDDLDVIAPTGLLDPASDTECRPLLLSIVSETRRVVLRHARGSVGRLILPGGENWELTHPDVWVLAVWDPAASPRSWRVLGALPSGRLPPHRSPIRLEAWTTAGRPISPGAQRLGWNSTLGRVETWTGSAWHQLLGPPDYTATAAAAAGAQVYTFAHGLGVVPTFWTAELECLSADLGYAVGDRTPITGGRTGDGSIALTSVASSSTLRILQRVTPRLIRADNPGQDGAIDPTRWRYVVRVWR